jgi:hypothetical protein
MRKQRFLLMPLDICGYYSGLANGLVDAGQDCHLIHLGEDSSGNWDQRRNAVVVTLYKAAHKHFHAVRSEKQGRLARYLSTLLYLAALTLALAWVLLRIDVIVMKSGEGFTSSQIDKALFKLAGKKIVYIYHGSDSRPPYLNAFWNRLPVERVFEQTRQQKASIERVTPYADIIIDNPLAAHLHSSSKVFTYQCIGNMMEGEKIFEILPRSLSAVRIVHAPSMAAIKGTDRVRAAMERLKSDGFEIEYVELSGRPNKDVMREIAQSDLVVDELYSDMHGAMLAIETLSMGKPAVVCGYGLDELEKSVPADAAPPTIFSHPDDLYASLRKLVSDPAYRLAAGRAGREFYERHSKPVRVAERLVAVVDGRAPEGWCFDPRDIRYFGGIGGPEETIAATTLRLVDAYGPASLCLEDKPELRDAMIAHFRAVLAERPVESAVPAC